MSIAKKKYDTNTVTIVSKLCLKIYLYLDIRTYVFKKRSCYFSLTGFQDELDDDDDDEESGDAEAERDKEREDDCICMACTTDAEDIPKKCCKQLPCMSTRAEGRFIHLFW